MFTSRLKDTDSILFCCIVKITYDFFPVFFSQLSLSFDSTFLHVLFPTFSVIFLINVIPSVLVFFLFTIIRVLIDFFRRSFFLFKSFEGERSEIYLTFFFPRYAKRVSPKVINIKGISSLLLRNYYINRFSREPLTKTLSSVRNSGH